MRVTHTLAGRGDSYHYVVGDRVAWGSSSMPTQFGIIDAIDHKANTVTLREMTRWERFRAAVRHPIRWLRALWRRWP